MISPTTLANLKPWPEQGEAQEQHAGGMLVVGEPDDPRVAVRGAHRVRDAEPLQAQNPLSLAGEVVRGSAAHPPTQTTMAS